MLSFFRLKISKGLFRENLLVPRDENFKIPGSCGDVRRHRQPRTCADILEHAGIKSDIQRYRRNMGKLKFPALGKFKMKDLHTFF